ncbi:MAG: urease accessory protein UreE [Hyphomicrobiaceae bacterium]|nr:urease accessory protein UreE [Hyphomicrobiaceae bacterium]MCC0023374.1 urease accessory protein UreE [Hyphomicrobiaceae bacterium]
MATCTQIRRAGTYDADKDRIKGSVTLPADQRHVRRKRLMLDDGAPVMLDLAQSIMLAHGDALVLDDGGLVVVEAAAEELMQVRPGAGTSVAQLAWHIGNRHLPAQVEESRILLQRDHVIEHMLEGLGALVSEVVEPFLPLHGAYHSHGHDPDHEHAHSHDHSHQHG